MRPQHARFRHWPVPDGCRTIPGDFRIDAGADRLHHAGVRGAGRTVLVIDRPVTHRRFFRQHGLQVEGALRSGVPSHGTAVAAAVAAVAPAATIAWQEIRFAKRALRRTNADVVVCAWGASPDDELEDAIRAAIPRLISVRIPGSPRIPGALPGVRCVERGTCWPTGAYRVAGTNKRFSGLSLAAGAAAGAACLLMGQGQSATEAIQSVTDATLRNPLRS